MRGKIAMLKPAGVTIRTAARVTGGSAAGLGGTSVPPYVLVKANCPSRPTVASTHVLTSSARRRNRGHQTL